MSWQGLSKVFGAKRRPNKRLEATCETHAPQAWRSAVQRVVKQGAVEVWNE
jgi:hypothetical protein